MGTFALSRELVTKIISSLLFTTLCSSYESFFLRSQLVRRLIKEDFDKCFEVRIPIGLNSTNNELGTKHRCFVDPHSPYSCKDPCRS